MKPFKQRRLSGSRTSSYDLAAHLRTVDSAGKEIDPHPQYLLKSAYIEGGSGEPGTGVIAIHQDDPNAHTKYYVRLDQISGTNVSDATKVPSAKLFFDSLATLNANISHKSDDTHTHTLVALGAAAANHTHDYAASNHTHTAYALVDHGHTPASIGAATADHSHTLVTLGAASSGHTHTAVDVGAASVNHSHTPSDIGAASANHNHDGVYIKVADKGLLVQASQVKTVIGTSTTDVPAMSLFKSLNDTFTAHHHDTVYLKSTDAASTYLAKTLLVTTQTNDATKVASAKLVYDFYTTFTEHKHDVLYAAKTHSHTAADVGAAEANHNHDGRYAAASHTHDIYSLATHNHDLVYLKITSLQEKGLYGKYIIGTSALDLNTVQEMCNRFVPANATNKPTSGAGFLETGFAEVTAPVADGSGGYSSAGEAYLRQVFTDSVSRATYQRVGSRGLTGSALSYTWSTWDSLGEGSKHVVGFTLGEEDPVTGEISYKLDAITSARMISRNADNASAIWLYVKSSSTATGNVVLVIENNKIQVSSVTIPITTSRVLQKVNFPANQAGRIVIRRDYENQYDTLKNGNDVISMIISDPVYLIEK